MMINVTTDKINAFLFTRKEVAGIALFRVLFGLLMFYQVIYYYQIDYPFQLMTGPEFLFSYDIWPLKIVLPLEVIRLLHHGLLVATILIIIGWWYRYAMAYFLIVFSYFTFLDKTIYNNHLYLFALLALIFCFVAADRRYALRRSVLTTVPAWNVHLLRFMVVMVYFYGAIAKLSSDWLSGGTTGPVIRQLSSVLPASLAEFIVVYGGILFDASIGFLLLYRPTRSIAILGVLLFNLANGLILFDDIGVFPYFMIATVVLFFDPESVRKFMLQFGFGKEHSDYRSVSPVLSRGSKGNKSPSEAPYQERRRLTKICLGIFLAFQLLWPLRSFVFAGPPEWNGIGIRFAWRMKSQTKSAELLTYTIKDPASGNSSQVDHTSFLSANQQRHFLEDPTYLIQFAHFLENQAKQRGFSADPQVFLANRVSMNGRPAQAWINPDVDLTKINPSSLDRSWLFTLAD